ncbi:MAG TPA: iron-containing alcohol dehydrogenase [Bacteroidales bacterium]|nr:iron-containing alcohol dehydrogenase [Bacteroidales bacterium]
MYNFDFYNPTKIFFGKDRLDVIDGQVPVNANVLITYGGGSAVRSGLIAKVKASLGSRKVVEFGGIEPNPQYTTLMKAVEVVRSEKIDYVLAVGGGSVIDGTKFITLAANYKGVGSDLLKFSFGGVPREVVSQTTPFGAVLTLPATGSEMNDGAVISYEHGKFAVMCDLSYPKFSILDPQVTYTLPKIQVANGIVDAFVHTTEQYITFPVDAKIQDRWAESILLTLIEIGKINVEEPENYDARANLVWSATMALNGIIGVGIPQDWATHMIGHELTAKFGIDHGQTLAIVYPAVLDIMRVQKQAKLLQYAERVWNITTGSTDEKIDKAIQKTIDFFESLGIKTKLSQYGVRKEEIGDIINQLEAHEMTKLGETQEITLEVSRKILEKAF